MFRSLVSSNQYLPTFIYHMLVEFVPLLYYLIGEPIFTYIFLVLILSSLKPFVRVLTFSLTMKTLFMSHLLKPLTHLNTSIRFFLTLYLSKECGLRCFNLSL